MPDTSPVTPPVLDETRTASSDFPPFGMERRRYARVALNLPAFVNVDECSFPSRCLNLSAGGALLRLDAPRLLPPTFLLHLLLPSLGNVPVPVVARRIEISGSRVRLAFDPLPAGLDRAIAAQVSKKKRSAASRLN